MNRLLSIFLVLSCSLQTTAQDCKVMIDSLKGNYKGNCKNGFANGEGSAYGVDTYTGKFKNGYPDGHGKYSWKNGSWYDGYWKKGLYDGEGTLHLIGADEKVREFSGIWLAGKFQGADSKPFKIYSTSNKISSVSIKKGRDMPMNTVLITVYDILNNASTPNSISQVFLEKKKMTDLQIVSGSFMNRINDEQSSPYNNFYKLTGVTFPLHLILYFDTERAEVEIVENGSWFVRVDLEIMN